MFKRCINKGAGMLNEEKFKKICKLLGQQIKNIRLFQNISLNEVSQKTGIRVSYLKKIEDGFAYGVLLNTHLVKISKALEVKLSKFFEFEEE